MTLLFSRGIFLMLFLSVVASQAAAQTSLSVGDTSVVSQSGAMVERSLNEKDQQYTEGVYEPVDGVWSVTGLGMDNVNVIETETGIVVIDGGLSPEYARKAISMLPPEVAAKPVKGIIYTHWHYIFGVGEWNVNEETIVVAHQNHDSEIAASSSDPRLAAVKQVRGNIMLGSYLPKEGADSPSVTGYIGGWPDDLSKYMKPTKLVGDAETSIVIDGMTFVTHAGHSDTLDGISIYIPSKKVSIDNVYWAHGLFNFSTLRGDRWRQTDLLNQATQWLLDQNVAYSLKVHGKPVPGEVFKEQLKAQLGTVKYIVEGTEDAIGKGLPPDELAYKVKLPSELANSPYLDQNYGEFSYHVRRYYAHLLHFFGNDSIDLHPLARNDEAKKMVMAMGGIDSVLMKAKEAGKKGEHQWSAQLATYAIRSGNEEAKQIKANALRAMAQQATAANTRNWVLTHALVLEGKVELPMVLTGEY